MPTPPPRRRFALTLEDAQPRSLAPPERRLARLLKCLLRYYGFRAIDAVETTPPPPEAQASEDPI